MNGTSVYPENSFSTSHSIDSSSSENGSGSTDPTSTSSPPNAKLTSHKRQASSKSSDIVDAPKAIVTIRMLEKGIRPSDSILKITLQEYRNLLELIEDLSDEDPLKGYWTDKLRYDYDSDTELFQILMPGDIHEGFVDAVRRQIEKYLKTAQSSGITAIEEFAGAIKGRGSADCGYTLKKDPDYMPMGISDFEEPSIGTKPGQTQSYTTRRTVNQLQPPEASTQRRSPRLERLPLRSDGPESGTHQRSEQATPSPPSDTSDVEKHLQPDCSFKFVSPDIRDTNAAFIVEVSSTQVPKDLETKIENYFKFCNATAVLACRIGRQYIEGPSIELFVRQGVVQQQDQKNYKPRWCVQILDKKGALLSQSEQDTYIRLVDFISRESLRDWLKHNMASFERQDGASYEELKSARGSLDIQELGEVLIKLLQEQESGRRKRKREEVDDPESPNQKRRLDAMIKGLEE